MRIIKKYKNRIMYDTETSKPINLRQIAEMIKENKAIQILDNVTGQDITRLTILQVLLDLEKSGKGVRHLIPDTIVWFIETTKQEYHKAFHEIRHGNLDFGHNWARRLVKDGIDDEILSSENEALMVEKIAAALGEVYEEVTHTIEQRLAEQFETIGNLMNTSPKNVVGALKSPSPQD